MKRIAFLLLITMLGVILQAEAEGQPRRSQRGRPGRGRDSGLKVAEKAPLFVAKSLDGKSEVDLSKIVGEKPVVLIFGSYT